MHGQNFLTCESQKNCQLMNGTRTTTTSGSDSDTEFWKKRQKKLLLTRQMDFGGGTRTNVDNGQGGSVENYANFVRPPNKKFLTHRSVTRVGGSGRQRPSFGVYGSSKACNGKNLHKNFYKNCHAYKYGSLTSQQNFYKKRRQPERMSRSRSEPDFIANVSMLVNPGDRLGSSSESEKSENSHYGQCPDNDESSSSSSWILDDDVVAVDKKKNSNFSRPRRNFSAPVPREFVLVYIGAVPVVDYRLIPPHRIVRSCLQSLRLQRSKARTVLMEIFAGQLVVTNSKNIVINRFKAECLILAQNCLENSQFFAILVGQQRHTTAVCHMFAVDLELCQHEGSSHIKYARKFDISCKVSRRNGFCKQFPDDSAPVIENLRKLVGYGDVARIDGSRGGREEAAVDAIQRREGPRRGAPFKQRVEHFGLFDYRKGSARVTPQQEGPARKTTTLISNDLTMSSITTDDLYTTSISEVTTVESSSTTPSMSSGSLANQNSRCKFDDAASIIRKVTFQENLLHSAYGSLPIALDRVKSACNNGNNNNNAKRVTFIDEENKNHNKVVVEKGKISSSGVPPFVQKFCPSAAAAPSDVPASQKSSASNRTDAIAGCERPIDEAKSIFDRKKVEISGKMLNSRNLPEKLTESDVKPVGQFLSYSSSDLYRKYGSTDCSGAGQISASVCVDTKMEPPVDSPLSAPPIVRGFFKIPAAKCPTKPSTIGVKSVVDQSSSLPRKSPTVYGKSADSDKFDGFASTVVEKPQNVGGFLLKRLTRAETRFSLRVKQAHKRRLESWAADFEILLRDPAGLLSFAGYLRKQFCQENLSFWVACENFKLLNEELLIEEANKLYAKYIESGCLEPINVDSTAKQQIDELMAKGLTEKSMFDMAQTQIFHLMKYDCYPRFLKSEEYGKCWMNSVDKSEPLPGVEEPFLKNFRSFDEQYKILDKKYGGSSLKNTIQTASLTKSIEDERKTTLNKEKKRKSLLPWKSNFLGRTNNNSKGINAKSVDYCGSTSIEQEILGYCSQSASTSNDVIKTDKFPSACPVAAAGGVSLNDRETDEKAPRVSAIECTSGHTPNRTFSAHGNLHTMGSNPNNSMGSPPDVVPQPDPPSSPKINPKASTSDLSPVISADQWKFDDFAADSPSHPSCTVVLTSKERFRVGVPPSGDPGVTVKDWLWDVAPRFKLNPAGTDVLLAEDCTPVDLSASAFQALSNCTVLLEGGVTFQVDIPCLPNDRTKNAQRKLICVKAATESTSAQALRPIFSECGLSLDQMIVTVHGSNEVLPSHAPISQADNKKLVVLSQQEFQDWVHRDARDLDKAFDFKKYDVTLPEKTGLEKNSVPSSNHSDVAGKRALFGFKTSLGGGMLKFVKKQRSKNRDVGLASKKSSATVKNRKIPQQQVQNAGKKFGASEVKGLDPAFSVVKIPSGRTVSSIDQNAANCEILGEAKYGDPRPSTGHSSRPLSLTPPLPPASDQQIFSASHDRRQLVEKFFDQSDDDDDRENDDDWLEGNAAIRADLLVDGGVVPSCDDAERLFGGVMDKVGDDMFSDDFSEKRNLVDHGFSVASTSKSLDIENLSGGPNFSSTLERNVRSFDGDSKSSDSRKILWNDLIGPKQKSIDDLAKAGNGSLLYVDNEHQWQIDYV